MHLTITTHDKLWYVVFGLNIFISLSHFSSSDARDKKNKPLCDGFFCENSKCIARSLLCDGVDNCFDHFDTDETKWCDGLCFRLFFLTYAHFSNHLQSSVSNIVPSYQEAPWIDSTCSNNEDTWINQSSILTSVRIFVELLQLMVCIIVLFMVKLCVIIVIILLSSLMKIPVS